MITGPCHCAESAEPHRDHPNLCASCAHQRQPRVNWEREWCHLATTGTDAAQGRFVVYCATLRNGCQAWTPRDTTGGTP